jgi:MtrB/PioB family decaheme-associated outer membrane protein
MLSALSGTAAAADSAPGADKTGPDFSEWKCETCKFEEGTSGSVNVGVGSVSDTSAKFGEYNGLDQKGGYFIGDADVRTRGKDGSYWNLDVSDIGLDARSVAGEGGQQGKYKLLLKYDQIPHIRTNDSQTPFIGNGGTTLTLPTGYPAGTTGLMPLAGTLQPVEISTQRKRLGLGGAWLAMTDWEYALNYRHESRDGTKRTSGSFFSNAANLVEPISYDTDQLDASVSYLGHQWQAKLAYYGSTFRNANDSLTWQNPFTPLAGGSSGQLALPPDNQFHQVLASAGYQFSDRTRATADVAMGRMSQNENFLPSTQNRLLAPGQLPGSSLDGRADTLNANLKLNSAVTDKVRLTAAYLHNDRDNRTSQAAYPSVATDMFVGLPRTNLPYSFKQEKWSLLAEYKATAKTRAAVGYDNDTQKRTFLEANKTEDDTLWGKVSTGILDMIDLTFRYAHGERRNSGYQAVPAITPPENPLMRKFYMANRTRDSGGLRADIAARENVNIGFGVEHSKDQYSDSSIGLTGGSDFNVNGDVSVVLTPQTSVHLFANREIIKSKQAGSQAFSTPDWTGDNRDTIDSFGFGLKHAAIKDKLDIGADYTMSRTKGDVNVNAGVSDPGFPTLTTSLDSLKLYATYRLKENVSVNAGYWYERYDSKNWALESVAPGTIPNFLAFGDQPPRYKVNVVRVSMKYKF